MPILVFCLLAPVFLIRQRWRLDDTARALARVDKTLRLDERTLTAWELLERNETRAAALMGLKGGGRETHGVRSEGAASTKLELAGLSGSSASSPFGSDFLVWRRSSIRQRVCSFLLRRPWRRSCGSFLETSRRRPRTRDCRKASGWVGSWSSWRRRASRRKPTTKSSKPNWPGCKTRSTRRENRPPNISRCQPLRASKTSGI